MAFLLYQYSMIYKPPNLHFVMEVAVDSISLVSIFNVLQGSNPYIVKLSILDDEMALNVSIWSFLLWEQLCISTSVCTPHTTHHTDTPTHLNTYTHLTYTHLTYTHLYIHKIMNWTLQRLNQEQFLKEIFSWESTVVFLGTRICHQRGGVKF